MKENFIFIGVIIPLILSIGFVQAYIPTLYDLDLIELSVLETKVIPIKEWVNGPLDHSDIFKVKFKVTNKGVEHYFIHKEMFRIYVFKIIEGKIDEDSIKAPVPLTTYYPQYLENLQIRFKDKLGNNFNDCVFIRHSVPINSSKTLTVCFDVLRKWEGEALKIDESKQYYLVLMDSRYSNPCPNCKEILIPIYSEPVVEQAQITKMPEWVKLVVKFWVADQIDDSGFVQVIEYLVQNEITSIPYAEASEGESVAEIPRWIKKSAEFWLNEKISDDELATSLEWLINNGIIRV